MSSRIHARKSENALQDLLNETVKILYNSDKGSEAMRRGLTMLREETGISFEIPNHFDAIIGISNIKIGPNRNLINIGLSALRPIDLPTVIISAECTIANRKIVSNIIKAVEENIKSSDAELIANAPDITSDDAEILKQISTCSFNDNMILQ
ncbi:16725_t:CDS:2 [Funneliformis geosporum]|uniref:16725_t:CDS:1 n=1 Tax=Funneliformis geosporum TaxID=1117311 RepID=A0A9W4SQJ5_9GLOM|nr:16725_t:CDS:2 [Funneliformis geosporum]